MSRCNSHYHNLVHSTALLWRDIYHATVSAFPRHVYDKLDDFDEQELIEWAIAPESFIPRAPVSLPRRLNTDIDAVKSSDILQRFSITEMKALAIETHFYLHQPCRCFVCLSIFDSPVPAVPEW
jgi:hypothetical protein